MDHRFEEELRATGYLRFPLPLHTEDSLEASLEGKQVLAGRAVWSNGTLEGWQSTGRGVNSLVEGAWNGQNAIRMTVDTAYDSIPDGAPPYNYAGYGNNIISLALDGEDWREYNRISFWVKPDYAGNDYVNLVFGFSSDGAVKVPDRYHREGYHVLNLKNNAWNHVIWEFPDVDRDRVTGLFFRCGAKGRHGAIARSECYDIADIRLERVATTDWSRGWQGAPNTILYATAGYERVGRKTAIATAEAAEFALVDAATGKTAFTGPTRRVSGEMGVFHVCDFTAFTGAGSYLLRVGGAQSAAFPIEDHILKSTIWKSINFLLCQRCGYPVGNVHGGCHFDCYADHDGRRIVYNGGWHDAADKSQQTVQTAEIAHAMFEMADAVDDDPNLAARLLEEANWGLDLALRTRFGDGYRVLSMGGIRYSNGIIGDFDDISNASSGNYPLENFLFAGIEADAARVLRSHGLRGRAQASLDAACEDFRFALEEYDAHGFVPQGHGHTRTTSPAQFAANASWAASMLYRATGEREYAAAARRFMDEMLACQETGETGLPLRGMFYRDRDHKSFTHYNHQSREQAFAQALVAIATTQKDHADLPRWERAMRLYGQYLKDLMQYSAPYGLAPAGVYFGREADDRELFAVSHPASKFEDERDNVAEQIKNGVKIGPDAYVRRFPVWCSFRGNAAVNLASGKAASAIGKYFGDGELIDIGREQIYWNLGKNPFGQSIMYGEGKRFQWQYAGASGDQVGQLPVGMESFGNEDAPYWPQGNNCTYKEVWTSPTGRFFWLAADLY